MSVINLLMCFKNYFLSLIKRYFVLKFLAYASKNNIPVVSSTTYNGKIHNKLSCSNIKQINAKNCHKE